MATDTEDKPMLKVSEAAGLLGLGERTVWAMIKDGEIASYSMRGQRRISREDVDTYLKDHREH